MRRGLGRVVAGFESLRDPARALFAAAALWILGSALLLPARSLGDGGEYQMMTESLARHLSPDMQARDIAALASQEQRYRTGINLAPVYGAYFDDGQGRLYCYHFWGYSLAAAPLKLVLRVVRANALAALQVTNALLFLWALHQALFASTFGRQWRLVVAPLFLFSPIAWFVLWPHPEAACAALVMVAALWSVAGRRHGPVLCAALAATQNPPLVWLVGALWLRAWLPHLRSWRDDRRGLAHAMLLASGAAAPALLSPLFFLWKFGTPSLVARHSADLALMSVDRMLDLFVDLNLGLLPYLPLTLLLFVIGLGSWLLRPSRAGRAVEVLIVLGLMAYSCTVTHNWNHGTAGPSRYTVWMLPLILVATVEWLAGLASAGAWRQRVAVGLAALVVIAQATVMFARGGLVQGDDSLVHSWAARLVLRQAPSLYNPPPAIFVSRTTHVPASDGYAVYRDGGCRKARVRPKDGPRLSVDCGFLPAGSEAFFSRQVGPRRWAYVDY